MHAPYPSTELLWSFAEELDGAMNNSLILTSHILGSEEPRVIISNNDHFVKFFDIPVRTRPTTFAHSEFGILNLEYNINQCK